MDLLPDPFGTPGAHSAQRASACGYLLAARTRWTAAMMRRLNRKTTKSTGDNSSNRIADATAAMMAALTTGAPALPCPLDGCPDRVLTAQACLHPLGTGFLLCATALGQYIESLVCQRSQRSRGTASACDAIELVSPPTTFCSSLAAALPTAALSTEVKALAGLCSARTPRVVAVAVELMTLPSFASTYPLSRFRHSRTASAKGMDTSGASRALGTSLSRPSRTRAPPVTMRRHCASRPFRGSGPKCSDDMRLRSARCAARRAFHGCVLPPPVGANELSAPAYRAHRCHGAFAQTVHETARTRPRGTAVGPRSCSPSAGPASGLAIRMTCTGVCRGTPVARGESASILIESFAG